MTLIEPTIQSEETIIDVEKEVTKMLHNVAVLESEGKGQTVLRAAKVVSITNFNDTLLGDFDEYYYMSLTPEYRKNNSMRDILCGWITPRISSFKTERQQKALSRFCSHFGGE